MKYFVILLILIGLIIPQAFGVSEEIIHGRSSFELLPSEIITDNPVSFEIVFMYYDHPYSIESLLPIIEINPSSALSNVHIEIEPISVYPGQIFRIPVNMTINSEIEHEKIFLTLSFIGNNPKTYTVYKSGWTESAIIDVIQNDVDYSGNIIPGELKTQVGRIYPSETDSEALAETGLTEISSSVLTGIKIIEFGMFDSENYENSVHQLYVGKKYWFVFEYQNESEKPQDIEAFVKLIDKNRTEDNVLQKIEGSTTLESSKGLGHGFGWTPEYVGEFKITAKVISPNDSLVGVIAPQYDLVVIERPLLKQQIQNQTPIDDILCKKSDHFLAERTNKKFACVSMDAAKKLGWKLVHFEEIILDPATKKSLLERYSDLPEVVAFYEKYDANVEVRQDHISYFAGNEDDFLVRMNLELDKNHDIENIEFHCYAQRVHQVEVPHDNILKFLEGYTCDETGAHRNKN